MKTFLARRFAHAIAPPLQGVTRDGRIANGGGLGWTPSTFWSATLAEFDMATRPPQSEETTIGMAEARRIALGHGLKLYGE